MAKVQPRTARYEGKSLTYFNRRMYVPLYEWNIEVVYAEDIHAVRRAQYYTKHMGLDPWALDRTTATAFCESDYRQRKSWIFLQFSPDGFRTASVGVTAHECYHAAYTILHRARADDSEEGVAYMLEHIVDFADKFACDIHDFGKALTDKTP